MLKERFVVFALSPCAEPNDSRTPKLTCLCPGPTSLGIGEVRSPFTLRAVSACRGTKKPITSHRSKFFPTQI